MNIKDSRVEGSSAEHVIPCVKLGDQEPLNPLWSPEGEGSKITFKSSNTNNGLFH